MGSQRYGEQGSPPLFRNKRVYHANAQWYFDTREGTQFGPFQSEDEANKALAFFVAVSVNESQANRPGDECDELGAQDGITHMVQEILGFLQTREEQGQLNALTWANIRLKELAKSYGVDPTALDRHEALKFAMVQSERPFDFEIFNGLGRRA